MFSFSTLFALLTEAPTIIADVEALLASPQVQELEKLIAANFTHVTTPGAASVLEPVVKPVSASAAPHHSL